MPWHMKKNYNILWPQSGRFYLVLSPLPLSSVSASPNGPGWALDNPVRTTTQWLTPTAGLGTQTLHFAGFRVQSTPPHAPANPDLTQICAKPVPSQPRQPYFLSCYKSQNRQLPSSNDSSIPQGIIHSICSNEKNIIPLLLFHGGYFLD